MIASQSINGRFYKLLLEKNLTVWQPCMAPITSCSFNRHLVNERRSWPLGGGAGTDPGYALISIPESYQMLLHHHYMYTVVCCHFCALTVVLF